MFKNVKKILFFFFFLLIIAETKTAKLKMSDFTIMTCKGLLHCNSLFMDLSDKFHLTMSILDWRLYHYKYNDQRVLQDFHAEDCNQLDFILEHPRIHDPCPAFIERILTAISSQFVCTRCWSLSGKRRLEAPFQIPICILMKKVGSKYLKIY